MLSTAKMGNCKRFIECPRTSGLERRHMVNRVVISNHSPECKMVNFHSIAL